MEQKPRAAVLLVQLGTPDSPETPDVRRYLREFLSDTRVVEKPRWQWWPILYGLVLTRRPKESGEKYRSIWQEDGSPLLINTRLQAQGLREELKKRGRLVEVAWAMRYGKPSMAKALRELRERGFDRILVLPLYPQYSGSTTGTVFDVIAREFLRWRTIPSLRFVQDFHDDPGYIAALADSIRQRWRNSPEGRPEKLIFSFHGVPQFTVDDGDPYQKQCLQTAAMTAEALGLEKDDYVVSFQSLFGRDEWIKPYTQPTVEALARKGIKRIDVVCPGFVADCIETLEEVNMEIRQAFLDNGGEQFRYIECLNDAPLWIHAMADIVSSELSGWGTREVDPVRARLAG
ncbi:MAG: ferrochelatase [Lautropia sp.]|nr:ferrochelatase [Lautropia sp.]